MVINAIQAKIGLTLIGLNILWSAGSNSKTLVEYNTNITLTAKTQMRLGGSDVDTKIDWTLRLTPPM